MSELKTVDTLQDALNGFTGTEKYHKVSFPGRVAITDGIKYLCEQAECHWLIDIIDSYQPQLKKKEAIFQIWKLEVFDDYTAIVTCREDTTHPIIIKQKIPYTDFKRTARMNEIEFYCIDRICLLKNEY